MEKVLQRDRVKNENVRERMNIARVSSINNIIDAKIKMGLCAAWAMIDGQNGPFLKE